MGSNATDAHCSSAHPTVLLEVRRSDRVKLLCRVWKQEKAMQPGVVSCPAAQPFAQADAGLRFGSVAGLSRRAAPLSSGVGPFGTWLLRCCCDMGYAEHYNLNRVKSLWRKMK